MLGTNKKQIDGLHEGRVFEVQGRDYVEIGQQLVTIRNNGREITAETVFELVERNVIDFYLKKQVRYLTGFNGLSYTDFISV